MNNKLFEQHFPCLFLLIIASQKWKKRPELCAGSLIIVFSLLLRFIFATQRVKKRDVLNTFGDIIHISGLEHSSSITYALKKKTVWVKIKVSHTHSNVLVTNCKNHLVYVTVYCVEVNRVKNFAKKFNLFSLLLPLGYISCDREEKDTQSSNCHVQKSPAKVLCNCLSFHFATQF